MNNFKFYTVELQYYLQEVDDIPTGTLYKKYKTVIIDSTYDLDAAVAIAYQLLLGDIIVECNLIRYFKKFNTKQLLDRASKMVVITSRIIYDKDVDNVIAEY